MKQQKSGIKKEIIKIFYLRVAALFVGAAILFSACKNDIEQIKAFSSPKDLPVVTAEDFETTSIDSGKVRFFLKAPLLQKFDNDGQSYIEFPKGLLLNKYDDNFRLISSITADYAKQFEKEEKWEAKNNVVAVNAEGDTLKTEHLILEEKADKIYSDKFVKIITTDRIIKGVGFRSNQNMEKWRIEKVTGTIYIDVNKKNPDSEQEKTIEGNTIKQEQKAKVNVQQPVKFKK